MNVINFAITANNGFIGSHLKAKLLNNKNCNSYLFDRNCKSIDSNNLNYRKTNLFDNAQETNYFKNFNLVYCLVSETNDKLTINEIVNTKLLNVNLNFKFTPIKQGIQETYHFTKSEYLKKT